MGELDQRTEEAAKVAAGGTELSLRFEMTISTGMGLPEAISLLASYTQVSGTVRNLTVQAELSDAPGVPPEPPAQLPLMLSPVE